MLRLARTAVGILFLLVVQAAPARGQGDEAMTSRVAACTTCHAAQGLELEQGYVPRIHGQPAGYLYNQLVNYQMYRRRNTSMNHMVAHLSRDYLFEIAQYFADRHPPYPPASRRPAPALAKRGEQLVRNGDERAGIPACATCHGERLSGVKPNTPGLVGLPRHYILAQLGAWKVGTRHAAAPDCMADIAAKLDGDDLEAAAAWLATRPIPDDTRPAEQPITEPPLECGSVSAPQR